MPETKKVNFNFKVTGALMSLGVYANGKEVKHTIQDGVYKGSFEREYGKNEDVIIKFTMGAPNGTGYKIEYDAKTNGLPSKDPSNLSPVEGTIVSYNAKIEQVKL